MDQYQNQSRSSFVSSCVSLLGFLAVTGLGILILIGILFVTLEPLFLAAPESIQDPVVPTGTSLPISVVAAVEMSEDRAITLPATPRVILTPYSTRTQRPTSTFYITCTYTIRSGDTLFSIAQKFGIANWMGIRCYSRGCNLSNPKKLGVGWQVTIPNVAGYTCLQRGGNYP